MPGRSCKPTERRSHFIWSWSRNFPTKTELAEREQIMTAFAHIGGLIADEAKRAQFRAIRGFDFATEFRRARLGSESRRIDPRRHFARQLW